MLLACGSIFGIMYRSSTSDTSQMSMHLTNQLHENVRTSVDLLIETLRRPAQSIQALEPALLNCQIPNDVGIGPLILTRIVNAYTSSDSSSGTAPEPQNELESLGVVQQQSNNSLVRYSWSVGLGRGKGYNCSQYVYLSQDSYSEQEERAICLWFNGTADGTRDHIHDAKTLSVPEQALLNGKGTELFLPIEYDAERGKFILAYAKPFTCSGQELPYVYTFAEKSLVQFDDYLSQFDMGVDGIVYIVETSTGLLVSSSEPDQLLSANGSRVNCTEASDPVIAESARALLNHANASGLAGWIHFTRRETLLEKGMVMVAQRYNTKTGLDWIVVLVFDRSEFYGNVETSAAMSGVAAVIITVVALIIILLTMHCMVSRPLRRIMLYIRPGQSATTAPSFGDMSSLFSLNDFCLRELHPEEYEHVEDMSMQDSQNNRPPTILELEEPHDLTHRRQQQHNAAQHHFMVGQ